MTKTFHSLSGRGNSIARAEFLLERELQRASRSSKLDSGRGDEEPLAEALEGERNNSVGNCFSFLLEQAGFPSRTRLFVLLVILGGVVGFVVSAEVCSPYAAPFFAMIGAYLPVSYLERRKELREAAFAGEFPAILLATASSVRVGMTPYQALERSVGMLKKNSLLRTEVCSLMRRLSEKTPREQAIEGFARSFSLPEINLFRTALLLSLEHGGRFSPTLGRLAKVTQDRLTLIHQARVSTATMRMTANVIAATVPFVVLVLSSRMPSFWDTLRTNDLANGLATTGALLMAISFLILKRMSSFKP